MHRQGKIILLFLCLFERRVALLLLFVDVGVVIEKVKMEDGEWNG